MGPRQVGYYSMMPRWQATCILHQWLDVTYHLNGERLDTGARQGHRAGDALDQKWKLCQMIFDTPRHGPLGIGTESILLYLAPVRPPPNPAPRLVPPSTSHPWQNFQTTRSSITLPVLSLAFQISMPYLPLLPLPLPHNTPRAGRSSNSSSNCNRNPPRDI